MSAFAQRSSHERWWIIGGVVAALVITLVGWLLFISPQRAETSDVNAQAADVRATNIEWKGKISSLRAESKNAAAVTNALTVARQALPSTSGVPDFLRSLQALGNTTGTDVVSLSVGQPADVSSVVKGSPKGIYALTISAQVNGPTARLDAFLHKLQTVQPRAVLITHITRGSAEGASGNTLQLTMQCFTSPTR